MSVIERLVGGVTFKLGKNEEIIFQSKPSAMPELKIFRIIGYGILFFLCLLFLFADENMLIGFDLDLAIVIGLSVFLGFKYLNYAIIKKSVYIVTNKRLYVFERHALTTTNEATYDLDDIDRYYLNYESRFLNTGYITFENHYKDSEYTFNELPMKNVLDFYKAMKSELTFEDEVAESQ